jgi:hypothetical protein
MLQTHVVCCFTKVQQKLLELSIYYWAIDYTTKLIQMQLHPVIVLHTLKLQPNCFSRFVKV